MGAEEEQVEVERADRPVRDGADQRVRGVRTPPVSTTVVPVPSPWRWARSKTSATRTELVTTVSGPIVTRCWASAKVVVPPESAIALPGVTSAAAARAISSLAESSRVDFASKPGSWVRASSTGTAPPCTFSIAPTLASASRSRRIVMSDTFSRRVNSLTRTPPRRRTSSRISARRCSASRLLLSATYAAPPFVVPFL